MVSIIRARCFIWYRQLAYISEAWRRNVLDIARGFSNTSYMFSIFGFRMFLRCIVQSIVFGIPVVFTQLSGVVILAGNLPCGVVTGPQVALRIVLCIHKCSNQYRPWYKLIAHTLKTTPMQRNPGIKHSGRLNLLQSMKKISYIYFYLSSFFFS